MADIARHDPLASAMAGGGMPEGAQGIPGGPEGSAETERSHYGMMEVWAAMVGRGYGGLAYSTLRDVRGASRAWMARHKGLGNLYKAPDLDRILVTSNRSRGWFRDHSGRRQTFRREWGVIGTERHVLSRGARSPFGLHRFQTKGIFGIGGGKDPTMRNFITANVFENAVIQSNLVAQQLGHFTKYSDQQLKAMGERFFRIMRARGGKEFDWAAAFLHPDQMAGIGPDDLLGRVTKGSGLLMPQKLEGWIAKAAGSAKYGRLFTGGMRMAGTALPMVSAYFTFKLISDITAWSTKKVMRGLNWYYFKMPMQIYRAGTQGLRRPIMGAGTYVDSPGAQSERQRAVQAIQNSRLNARSALSAEAGLMHEHFG